jgi:hypothetical protein
MTSYLTVTDARQESASRGSAVSTLTSPLATSNCVHEGADPLPARALPLAPEPTLALALAQTRVVWWYGLGALWFLDALLQAQPIMFTNAGLVGNVLLPAVQGQPGWIANPMMWGAGVWASHSVTWNAGAVALQLLIAGLLLFGWQRPAWGRVGLVLSIGWGLIVWYFGQGLGGLFADSPTYLAGAPGSAMLYVLLAAALLLPDTAWSSPRLLPALRVTSGALWALGAMLQLAPLYWSPLGLASVLQNVAMMPLPAGLGGIDAQLVAAMAAAPALWNAALCAIMFGVGVAVALGRGGKAPYIIALIWLVFVWVVFQGFGMIFSNMGTDPNTAPVWALLLLTGWLALPASRPTLPTWASERVPLL